VAPSGSRFDWISFVSWRVGVFFGASHASRKYTQTPEGNSGKSFTVESDVTGETGIAAVNGNVTAITDFAVEKSPCDQATLF
jgi:hypothetical protein